MVAAKEPLSRERIEGIIERNLSSHWDDRAAAIVIDPELEIWVWADSLHVAEAIGWTGGIQDLREWLRSEGLLAEGQAKPQDPKAALRRAWQRPRVPISSALFESLASKVSFRSCTDPAFQKLIASLRRWFPADPA